MKGFKQWFGLPGIALPLLTHSHQAARSQSRMFHPDGQTFFAEVTSLHTPGAVGALGDRLAGFALARFSGALWRGGFEHLEVLGIALRFRAIKLDTAERMDDDQDLLFATIISPFTMPFSPFTTDGHDYLNNRYWAVSRFDVIGIGPLKFRLSPAKLPLQSDLPRRESLLHALSSRHAVMHVEARRTFSRVWTKLAALDLTGVANTDQIALRFSPFLNGRGIVPRGLVHAMRRAAYKASQDARAAKTL